MVDNSEQPSNTATRSSAFLGVLHFLSGRYQGLEVPLIQGQHITIGRSYKADVVLLEPDISREHLRIVIANDGLIAEDLGSTNGSFVNGRKIEFAELKAGDRILIGKTVIELLTQDTAVRDINVSDAKTAFIQPTAVRRREKSMVGSIEEIPLADLLQLMSTSGKTGVLHLKTPKGCGKLNFDKGRLISASLDDNPNMAPTKSLFRILRWNSGSFELSRPEPVLPERELRATTQALLMEGMRQLDEFTGLLQRFPPLHSTLRVPAMGVELEDLEPREQQILKSVSQSSSIRDVLNHCQLTDLDILQGVEKLLLEGYLLASAV